MEYGGYIELEKFQGNMLHSGGIALNCGRSCLGYLLEASAVEKIYLPYFLGETIRNFAKRYNKEIIFYRIDRQFRPVIDFEVSDNEFLYLVNFYGQLTEEYIGQCLRKFKNIILDNTQNYFAEPMKGVHTIYICRKYFGVPDGAFLFTTVQNDNEYERDIVNDRMRYLLGRFEENATKFYESYQRSNEYFDGKPVKRMSLISENILRAVDYEAVKNRRTENWEYVSDRLSKYNKLNLIKSEGPFAYPLLVSDGMKIKSKLAKNQVYVPTLWSNVIEECTVGTIEHEYASDILPIPIDHRYSLQDMRAMCEIIEGVIC